MSQKIRRGISKAEWLEAGLQALCTGSVTDITVEGLARSLGIAKAGFYWHFKSRDDLLHQLLDYWVHEITEVAAENPQLLALEPKKRLITIAEMIPDGVLGRVFGDGVPFVAHRRSPASTPRASANRLTIAADGFLP